MAQWWNLVDTIELKSIAFGIRVRVPIGLQTTINMDYKEKIESRERCNATLVNYVALCMLMHPELRYIQLLWATKIVDSEDRFYEEPYDTIVRVLQTITESLQMSESDERRDVQMLREWLINELKSMNLI